MGTEINPGKIAENEIIGAISEVRLGERTSRPQNRVVEQDLREFGESTKDSVEDDSVTVDAVLSGINQLGRFHLMYYFMVFWAIFFDSVYGFNYILIAGSVEYRCLIEECELANTTVWAPAWASGAAPDTGRGRRCLRYSLPAGASCSADSFTSDTRPCEAWVYQSRDTIVAEFDLACEEWKRTLVGTIHNVGMLVSLPIGGYISDRWGRKTALVLSATLVGAIGTLKAFSTSYSMYITVEFLETVAGASAFPAAYVLTIELLSTKRRVLITAFIGITLVIGGICFALIAKALPYWRTFILAVYPPSLLFLSYIYLMPESIRWLLSKGRNEDAIKIVQKAAKFNKVTISEEMIAKLRTYQIKEKSEKEKTEDEESLPRQVLRSKVIRTRLLICAFWWITCTFVFYGLAINSVSLAGDKYTNFILVVSVEIIAVVINAFALDRIGRKRTLLGSYTVCGISCIVITFIPKSLPWLVTCLYLLGKITITMAFSGIYMYTSELFPTKGRHSLLGFCSMVGRLGSIIAPQMPLLAVYMESLPSILFGCTAITSGLLMLLTPETLNAKLPDTIQEAEELSQKRIPESLEMKQKS